MNIFISLYWICKIFKWSPVTSFMNKFILFYYLNVVYLFYFFPYFFLQNSEATPSLQNLYGQIRNILQRLNTFVAISEKPLTADKWLTFCKVNLIEECQSLFQQVRFNLKKLGHSVLIEPHFDPSDSSILMKLYR